MFSQDMATRLDYTMVLSIMSYNNRVTCTPDMTVVPMLSMNNAAIDFWALNSRFGNILVYRYDMVFVICAYQDCKQSKKGNRAYTFTLSKTV